jgi:hypothetical protein
MEVYFRTSRRLFVLKFPAHEDRIFNLHPPANPMNSKYWNWSEWQSPDFVAKAGQQPTRFSAETITRFDTRWITRTRSCAEIVSAERTVYV